MRKIFQIAALLSMLLLCAAALNATPAPDGRKKVKEENKDRVVCFFSKNCEYCSMMGRDVLNDKEIRGLLERDVVYLRVDVEKKPEIATKQGVRGYPTTLLVESTGKTIARTPGYISKKEFKKYCSISKKNDIKQPGSGIFSRQKEQNNVFKI